MLLVMRKVLEKVLASARDGERPRLVALLTREGSGEIVDSSFTSVRQSTLLLTLRYLQSVLQNPDFTTELITRSDLVDLLKLRAATMLVPRVKADASITLTTTSMACLHATLTPLLFVQEVVAIKEANLQGATGTVQLGPFRLSILYNRPAQRQARLKAAVAAAAAPAAAPAGASAAAPAGAPAGARRKRVVSVRFAQRRRLGHAVFVTINGDGVVPHAEHDLLGEEVVEKAKISPKKLAKELKQSRGINYTGRVYKVTATRGKGKLKDYLLRGSVVETARLVREKTGLANLDVGGCDFGKGNSFSKIVRPETHNGAAVDVTYKIDLSTRRSSKLFDPVYDARPTPTPAPPAAAPDSTSTPAPAAVAPERASSSSSSSAAAAAAASTPSAGLAVGSEWSSAAPLPPPPDAGVDTHEDIRRRCRRQAD
jgi:hypothetical protein